MNIVVSNTLMDAHVKNRVTSLTGTIVAISTNTDGNLLFTVLSTASKHFVVDYAVNWTLISSES